MSSNALGKVHERAKPELIKVGKHERTSTGRYNVALMADFLIAKARHVWMPISEIARVAYGAPMIRAKEQVRKRNSHLSKELLRRGFLLLVDRSGDHGRIMQVKIYDPDNPVERDLISRQIEDMRRRSEYTAEQYATAVQLLYLPAATAA